MTKNTCEPTVSRVDCVCDGGHRLMGVQIASAHDDGSLLYDIEEMYDRLDNP